MGGREFSEVPELTPKVSYLQVVNDVDGTSRKGTFSAKGVLIYSVKDNRTALHLGRGANVLTTKYIFMQLIKIAMLTYFSATLHLMKPSMA